MARLERLRVYPVKSLAGVDLDAARVTEGGVLEYDRQYKLVDGDGDTVNGRRNPRIHALDTTFDPETHVLTVRVDGETRQFSLLDDREEAAAWFGDFFGFDVSIRRDAEDGFVDRSSAGPSVISSATLSEVASWFDDLTVENVRRRMRANVEVSGVSAFWEDGFVGDGTTAFTVGGVRFEGVEPCVRCSVPQHDPDTGELTPEFRKRFVERRRTTFPDWADRSAFHHDYTLMLIARIPPADRGRTLRVGDGVTVDSA